MTFKLGPKQEKWLRAAESGKYEQTAGRMRLSQAYCFLGLATRACGLKEDSSVALDDTFGEVGLRSPSGRFSRPRVVVKGRHAVKSLMGANDGIRATFAEIAAFIRANPEVVFKESK